MADKIAPKDERILVRFDVDKVEAQVPRGPNAGKRIGTVTHFVERPAETPTGGKYTSRKFRVTMPGGRVWYGTVKKGTNLVKLRPSDA